MFLYIRISRNQEWPMEKKEMEIERQELLKEQRNDCKGKKLN